MPLNLGDTVPDFSLDSNLGKINFHEYIGDGWAVLCSHPADYTPVCTTELARVAELMPEFAKRNTKVVGLSCDSAETHRGWIKDIQAYEGMNGKSPEFPFPLVADEKKEVAVTFGMLDPVEKDKAGMPVTCRAVFVIFQKKIKLQIIYPATTGRNFDELLRVIDSLQLTVYHSVATPADWKSGQKCCVVPSVSQEDAIKKFPKGVDTYTLPSGKGYLRLTSDPRS